MTRYGLTSRLDYIVLGASSPFGRIDLGCDRSQEATLVAAPCDNVTPPQVGVTDDTNGAAAQNAFDKWLSTSSCLQQPTSDEARLFARSSVVAPDADFTFATPLTTYDCIDAATLNVVPGGGHYVHDALRANDPTASRFKASCAVSAPAPAAPACTGEEVFEDATMKQAAIEDMDQHCVALAR